MGIYNLACSLINWGEFFYKVFYLWSNIIYKYKQSYFSKTHRAVCGFYLYNDSILWVEIKNINIISSLIQC